MIYRFIAHHKNGPSPRSFSAKEPFITLPGGFPIENPLNIARRMQSECRVNLKISYAEVQPKVKHM